MSATTWVLLRRACLSAGRSDRLIQFAAQIPGQVKIGRAVETGLSAAATAGAPRRIRHAPQAGVVPDGESLEALVTEQEIESYRAQGGAEVLELEPRAPGQLFSARYRAVPTFAGLLHSGPSAVELTSRPGLVHFSPPAIWDVR